jgi:hypothetical protein
MNENNEMERISHKNSIIINKSFNPSSYVNNLGHFDSLI